MESVRIQQATQRDLHEISRLMATALQNDSVIMAFIPGDLDRIARLNRIFLGELRTGMKSGGVIEVIRLHLAGPIVGAAVWERPGHKASRWALVREALGFIRAVGLRNLAQSFRLGEAFDAHRPTQPHWYLTDLVVAPEAQGHGIGSKLLQYRLSQVDEEHRAAYLEATTPASRRLYERFGFVFQAELGMVEGGYPVGMFRAARDLAEDQP